MKRQPDPNETLSQAARQLGQRSWKARLKKHGARKLKAQLSAAGKIAAQMGVSGRPRVPDHKVKPASLYQRARRARLRAEEKLKKGETKNGKSR